MAMALNITSLEQLERLWKEGRVSEEQYRALGVALAERRAEPGPPARTWRFAGLLVLLLGLVPALSLHVVFARLMTIILKLTGPGTRLPSLAEFCRQTGFFLYYRPVGILALAAGIGILSAVHHLLPGGRTRRVYAWNIGILAVAWALFMLLVPLMEGLWVVERLVDWLATHPPQIAG